MGHILGSQNKKLRIFIKNLSSRLKRQSYIVLYLLTVRIRKIESHLKYVNKKLRIVLLILIIEYTFLRLV